MTIPFTDDEIVTKKEHRTGDDEEHDKETNELKSDYKTEFKAVVELDLEKKGHYYIRSHKHSPRIIESTILNAFLQLTTWFAIVITSFMKNTQNRLTKKKIYHWYYNVRKKFLGDHDQDWNSKSKEWILNNIVKTLRYIPKYIYTAYPFFPEKYDSFLKDDKQRVDMMTFEAARLSTFSTFPSSVGVFATRLASAGFYYTGQGDEVVCFSCGFRHSSWRKQDSPIDLHRKLSTECSFVLEMTKEEKEGTDTFSEHTHQSTDHIHQVTGACGNTSDMINSDINQCHHANKSHERYGKQNSIRNTNITSHSGDNLTSSTYTSQNVNKLYSRSSNDVNSLVRTSLNTNSVGNHISNNVNSRIRTSLNANSVESRSNNDVNSLTRIPNSEGGTNQSAYNQISNEASNPIGTLGMGICTDKPKYPKYAIRSERLASYKIWPRHLTQSPEELVCAGFFFTGIEDHCRCFYCGGGLKHWEPEDLPWTEHARWYQHCPFVRQNKGVKFIEDVLSGRDEENTPSLQSGENSQQTLNSNSKQSDFLKHPAVQPVSEFGYDTNTLQTAYDSLIRSGSTEITATSLLERIFLQEESRNGNQVKDVKVQSVTQPRHSNEEIKSSQSVPANDLELELSIKSLEEENQSLRDQQTCKICLDEPVSIVFLPCGHMAACLNCAPALRKCPICRAFIKGTVKAIMC